MKGKILLAGLLALVMSFGLTTAVAADSPTTVTVNWNGVGDVGGSVDTGDTVTTFASVASVGSHSGEFNVTDSNNNPYNYGVDNNESTLEAAITGTGWASLTVDRTDAKTSMYGAPGQQSYTGVSVTDGEATLQNRSTSNYASMRDCNYSWHSNNHVTVTNAVSYDIMRYMDSDSGASGANFAGINAIGEGDATLNCMGSEASAGQVKLGEGCGCYTNASFTATGSGSVLIEGIGTTSATTAMAPGMTGASSFSFVAGWASGNTISIPDYSTIAY